MYLVNELEYQPQVENSPTYTTNCGQYDTREVAQARLHDLYRQNVLDKDPDIIHHSEFNENSAMVEYDNGMVIEWEIVELN